MKLSGEHILYLRSMGKLFRVTAIFTSDAEANAYMEKHREEGLIAEFKPYLYIANLHDQGLKVAS